MSNLTKSILYFSILLVLFSACKKDSPNLLLNGTWTGGYGVHADDPLTPFSFIIKDKTVEMKFGNSAVIGTGTFSIYNNQFTATIYNTQTSTYFIYTAKYDRENKKLSSGNWAENPSENYGGKWYMSRN